MTPRTEHIVGPAGTIEVIVRGAGPVVVMIPSLGRGAEDFDHLAATLADAGFAAAAVQPRGIGGSDGPLAPLSMADLADDIAAVVRALAPGRATLVGHAFGNRVARMTATEHPELVESCVLLACGGVVPPLAEHAAALRRVFDPEVRGDDHLAAVDEAFFAPGNDASVWSDGWYPAVAEAQGRATAALDPAHWWGAGRSDVLVVQPLDDVVAPPANAERVAADIGPRATVVTIAAAGHALLPEQPEAVADAVLDWLAGRDRT